MIQSKINLCQVKFNNILEELVAKIIQLDSQSSLNNLVENQKNSYLVNNSKLGSAAPVVFEEESQPSNSRMSMISLDAPLKENKLEK